MMRAFALALIFCTLSLYAAGCRTDTRSPTQLATEMGQRQKETNAALASISIDAAASRYRNKTIKTYDLAHGTQVEYLGADGRCYLWYPGNTGINRCRWKIEKRLGRHARPGEKPVPYICYSYGPNSYNPATGHRGSGWQCDLALTQFTDQAGNVSYVIQWRRKPETRDVVTGDKYNLAKRSAVPFVMGKRTYTFSQLDAKIRSQ